MHEAGLGNQSSRTLRFELAFQNFLMAIASSVGTNGWVGAHRAPTHLSVLSPVSAAITQTYTIDYVGQTLMPMAVDSAE